MFRNRVTIEAYDDIPHERPYPQLYLKARAVVDGSRRRRELPVRAVALRPGDTLYLELVDGSKAIEAQTSGILLMGQNPDAPNKLNLWSIIWDRRPHPRESMAAPGQVVGASLNDEPLELPVEAAIQDEAVSAEVTFEPPSQHIAMDAARH